MNRSLALVFLVSSVTVSCGAQAQQSQDFDNHIVHYNAMGTNLLPPQMAQAYGIRRSSSRALLTITVMHKEDDPFGVPIRAGVKANGKNLTGQRRTIAMREVNDLQGAVYYLGELPVHNLEIYDFTVYVIVDGEDEPLTVNFRQQFYTE
jgi:hypothetical protein